MQTIEAMYENGTVVLLKDPCVKKSKVLVTFLDDLDEEWIKTFGSDLPGQIQEATDKDIELSASADLEADYLTEAEVAYYLKLEEL